MIVSTFHLSEEQKLVYEIMENTNRNLFVTGKAGTGKSYLLNYFRQHSKKNTLYTAPTGLAACNIEGVTLHSAFGFNNLRDNYPVKLNEDKREMFRNMDLLIIDEISMVRVDVFEQIDRVLKYANETDLPFGGKQIIIFGDIFQLPPVVATREENYYLMNKYGNVYFFNSIAYKKGCFDCIELNKIYRQTDTTFIDILNNVREGNLSMNEMRILNEHCVSEIPNNTLQLVPKKDISKQINKDNLSRIREREYSYNAKVTAGKNVNEKDYRCDFNLKLKVGASIMMIANDNGENRWVNGSRGVISYLSDNYIKVLIGGREYIVERVDFIKYKCFYNKEKQKITYVIESCVNQFPLILSYAITIHKAQGLTCEEVTCNLEECFAPGQVYVALSRCKNFEKLFLTHKIESRVIIVDNAIIDFYNSQMRKVL